ncbi:MAG: hypothetical protein CSB33_00580 [Desulfobacterales bacterium]|nr:MAG: hypothetical protein CSB33_00580 [Desulfobacterales bacterium]
MNQEQETETSQLRSTQSSAAAPRTKRLEDLLPFDWTGVRADLKLHPAPPDEDGQAAWVLEDPLRGNHFRLGYVEGQLLYCLITEPGVDEAVVRLMRTTGLRVPPAEVISFVTMLENERLTLTNGKKNEETTGAPASGISAYFQGLLKGQLFFRIPLLRPDRFLSRTCQPLSFLWSSPLRLIYLLAGILGGIQVFQRMEQYLSTFSYLFTPQGMLAFFFSLILLKIGHEFAHAYAAKSMGLHVRGMGVMFIVIWPLLYTDTTEAWTVPDRKRRMIISAAGVLFELAIGGLALFAWSFLPDGIPRSIAFFLSGTSILSSVLVNLNPFMRYDGYYLLMDWWGVDNLRSRSFSLTLHLFRRLILDWQGAPPEVHRHGRLLILYGILAMGYRLLIGLSIASAAYYLFFPAAGILVFIAQLWIFAGQPLVREWRRVISRKDLWGRPGRRYLSGGLLLVFFILASVPLPSMIRLPALYLHADAIRLETPAAAILKSDLPPEGKNVTRGELLARLVSEDLAFDLEINGFELEKVRTSIRLLGSGGEQGAYRVWLQAEENRLLSTGQKLRRALETLEIRSPVDGVITDINPDLYAGASLAADTFLLSVASPRKREVRAYVHENLLPRIPEGEVRAKIRFGSPDVPGISAVLIEKGAFPVRRMRNDTLFDIAGGPVVSVTENGEVFPRDAYFVFVFSPEEMPGELAHGLPAIAWVDGMSPPLITRGIRWVSRKVLERG